MRGGALWLLGALMLAASAALAEEQETLAAIRFEGNKTTQERVLLQEMAIHVGDPIDPQRIENSRQAIMNLGLFKEVTASLEEGNVLVITVVERFYILPLPLLDVRPEGDYSYGAELRFDNLAGLNQRLKITYEEKDSVTEDLPHAKEAGISYSYPRLAGSAYQLDFASKVKQHEIPWPDQYTPQATYRLDAWNSSLGVSRWANETHQSRGWRYGGGVSHQVNDYQFLNGIEGTLVDQQAVGLFAAIDFLGANDLALYREGRNFGYRAEIGAPFLESDFSYWRQQIYLRDYRHLTSSGANVNSQWQFGFANGCTFGCAAWSLGGASTLRGYAGDYVTGNLFALLNLEYHHPLSGFKQMRGVLFTDIGDAWADLESVTLNQVKSTLGVGVRWTVQSFVDLTLRFDYGYAIEAQTYRGYFSTRASF